MLTGVGGTTLFLLKDENGTSGALANSFIKLLFGLNWTLRGVTHSEFSLIGLTGVAFAAAVGTDVAGDGLDTDLSIGFGNGTS